MLKKLSPKEAAVFKFFEHLSELEKATEDKGKDGSKVTVQWSGGKATKEILEDALDDCQPGWLPAPRGENFESFGWHIGYDYDPEVAKKFSSPADYQAAYPTRGCTDIRIYDGQDHLRFLANRGVFKGMEKDWGDAFDSELYPVL